MDKFEMLVDRLREIAKVIGFPRRRTLDQAADTLENQRNEIKALRQIIEQQADTIRAWEKFRQDLLFDGKIPPEKWEGE